MTARFIFMTERPNVFSKLVWGSDSMASRCESNHGSPPNALPVAGARNMCSRCIGLSHSGSESLLSSRTNLAATDLRDG